MCLKGRSIVCMRAETRSKEFRPRQHAEIVVAQDYRLGSFRFRGLGVLGVLGVLNTFNFESELGWRVSASGFRDAWH